MADKPAFYPRVGNIKAKNFKSAQPAPFIDDPRAMDLPQYGDIDLSVPNKANLEMARRIAERDAQLKRQQDADTSPLEKVAGALQATRLMGSALTQSINSLPTRIAYGDEAAEKFMQERMYKPTQPKAYEYAGDVGEFLDRLETQYKLPPILPEAIALQHLTGPAASQVKQMATKGAMNVEKRLDPLVTQALERGGLQRDLLLGLGQGTQSNVIKPKGGNWMMGSMEGALNPLKRPVPAEVAPNIDPRFGINPEEQAVRRTQEIALNNWVDRNLGNYIKKEMGTPEDPVRKLAEEGIVHIAPEQVGLNRYHAPQDRLHAGMPQLGQSEAAKAWEDASDVAIKKTNIQNLINAGKSEPWMLKADPSTPIYYEGDSLHSHYLGFDHIMDVLRQDVAEGRIRPEQLNKVSMEQAVRRTYEYDQEMAKRMREAAIKQQEGFPVHKEYPEGYRWIELAMPKPSDNLPQGWTMLEPKGGVMRAVNEAGDRVIGNNMPELIKNLYYRHPDTPGNPRQMLEDALKYEGNTMGHCVGGYCPDVAAGKSRIFSLRDAKGEPHVTVEVRPNSVQKAIYNMPDADRQALAQSVKDQHFGGVMPGARDEDRYFSLIDQAYIDKYGQPAPNIVQIKGKQNAAPKADYLPYVQDFVRSGNWSDVGDLHNTGMRATKDIFSDAELQKLRELGHTDLPHIMPGEEIQRYHNMIVPEGQRLKYDAKGNIIGLEGAEGMKRGGVAISKNPDTMMMELGNQKMKNGVPAYGAGKAVIKEGLKAASEAERALPLRLPRALPKPASEINAHAERVARQMMGEHVTSGKAGDTRNLAGRSMKESQRVKGLEYEITPTKKVPESQVHESKIGDVNIAFPGDYTLSDVKLESIMGEPVGSIQEGGSRYGLGHMKKKVPNFWASNEGPAQQAQDKITDLAALFDPERVMAHHLAMGPIATNFAQHVADANLRRIDYSSLTPRDMNLFDEIISKGYPKRNPKTGETFMVGFPDWPGIADPQAAYKAMKRNPELRKWFNNRMNVPEVTEATNLPSGLDVRWATTHPDLRNMEVNLTGHSVGEMMPGESLTDTAQHKTYSKGIPGLYRGHQEVLTPFAISFPDAAEHIMSTQRPQDFTGTIQKVFPHQRIDQQWLDEYGAYRDRIKELTGKKKGGTVKKAEGGAITGDDLIIEERPL